MNPITTQESRALGYRRLARLLLALALTAGARDAAAVVGGCGKDVGYARVLSFGTVPEIETYIAEKAIGHLAWLKKNRMPAPEGDQATTAWMRDNRQRQMLEPMACSHGEFPLDYAVANGNLGAVRWLLDNGMEPAAYSRSSLRKSIFSRCGTPGRMYARPDGLSAEEVRERQLAAYRMLIGRGANVNDPDPFLRPGGCGNPEMHGVLRELGAKVTPDAFRTWVLGARSPGGAVLESRWATVRALAAGESFDFRGSGFEYSLLQMLDFRKGMPDYPHVVDQLERLSKIVRMSPGIVPGKPAVPRDVPAGFNPVRHACSFPELAAYPDAELVALVQSKPAAVAWDGIATVDVEVGKTKAPLLLALFNAHGTRTQWRIRRAKDAHILGVMVLQPEIGSALPPGELRFDPARPAFFGGAGDCGFLVKSYQDRASGKETVVFHPFQDPTLATHTFNPFRLRGMPQPQLFEGNRITVGERAPAGSLIGWPDSRRPEPATTRSRR